MTSPAYRLDGVEIDAATGCVRRAGVEIYLRTQPLQVLLYLLDHPGRTVTKEELRDALWKNVPVTDDALVQCVVEIRKALGDDSRRPKFLRTVAKAGYRFTPAVARVDSEGAVPEPPAPTVRDLQGLRFPRTSAAALAIVVLAGGLWLWRDARRPAPDVTLSQAPGVQRLMVAPFDNQSGRADLAWLRDGLVDILVTNLSRLERTSVLTRQQLVVLLERAGADAGESIGLERALDLARRGGADTVLLGSFAAAGESLRIDVRLHDARTGRFLGAERIVAEPKDRLFAQIDRLSAQLAGRLALRGADTLQRSGFVEVMTDSLDAYRYYVLGLEKTMAFQSEAGADLFKRAVAIDSRFAMAYARIGYAYAITAGDSARGTPFLEKALQLSGRLTDRDRLNIAAWYAMAHGEFTEAIATFRQIVGRYPDDTEGYWRLGLLLLGEERFAEAADVLLLGLHVDPEAKHLHNALGGVYVEMGRVDDGIAARRKYVTLAPREANAYDSLGLAYDWAGRYHDAIETYGRAVSLDPTFTPARLHLGNTYARLGRYHAAMNEYRAVIDRGRDRTERLRGYLSMALLHRRAGRLDEAWQVAHVEPALRREAPWVDVLLAGDRGERAVVRALAPQAFAILERSSDRGQRRSLILEQYLRGQLALVEGRLEEAVAHFRSAVRHRPIMWHIDPLHDCLAAADLRLQRFDEAIAEYRRVLRITPGFALAHYGLGRAFEGKGAAADAVAEYRRFLEIWREADADVPEVVAARHRLAALGGVRGSEPPSSPGARMR